jgi:3-oxoacyl-[acyl-carrier protein] reductase
MNRPLENRVALVSGSGRGIGRAVAMRLAREGAAVVVNDLDAAPGDEVAEAIRGAGGRAVACNGDVAAREFADRFVATALNEFGGLDIIVNNAGYTWDAVIQKMSDEQFDAIMDVHLKAPFRILRAASEYIRVTAKAESQTGAPRCRKVVNVSSIAGLYGNAGQANYSAAKAGIVGLTRTMAKEWGRYNVTVNCVAFGLIATRLTQQLGEEGASIKVGEREVSVGLHERTLAGIRAAIPLGREGATEEAASAVYMLCSPDSDYVTGQVLEVTGGVRF